ncbi:MAG: hypothetical protein M1820_005911 [Bogoriella megaspora]|nr:MAG: hypothetical protein M1820_005911 [Bogoriella megaspora]
MAACPPTAENTTSFYVKSTETECVTWYRLVGDLDSNTTPLILLHGGPGACHEYMLAFSDLYDAHKIPLIFYDMIGNGKSTRFPEKNGVESFWTVQLFIDQLENLINHLRLRTRGTKQYDILGHSFGGMMAANYAAANPTRLRKLVLAATPASAELYKKSLLGIRKMLPEKAQETLDRCEREGKKDSEEYGEANVEFYRRHLCRMEPWPREVATSIWHLLDDPTVYRAMWEASDFEIKGSLRNWTAVHDAPKIKSETLVLNAQYDEVQDLAVRPFFELIPKAKWAKLKDASHMAHWEKRDVYMQLVGDFLTGSK